MPAEARNWQEWADGETVRIINRPETDPLCRVVTRIVGRPQASFMVMRLQLDGKRLGQLAVYARGTDRYRTEHARLLALLHDPFAVAMANVLQHQEVVRLKDLLADDNRYLRREMLRISGDQVIGADLGLRDVMERVHRVAPLDSPVLILGETGVGKEVIANALHSLSSRSGNPFIKVNCGAIPDTLIDSELFGHEKGAFTGAAGRKRGRFERAHTGTLFLDEIGELPPAAQVRLLRVIQHQEIERVGGTEPVRVDIRIVAATHRDLERMVQEGRFREDLWFRLNVFPIRIPPLRERRGDLPALVAHFLEKKARELRMPRPELDPEAMERFRQYSWPGNVRELENAVERALIEHRGQTGSRLLSAGSLGGPVSKVRAAETPGVETDLLTLDQAMAGHIQRALDRSGGKVHGPGGAAELLAINPNTLRCRMDKLGIDYRKRR